MRTAPTMLFDGESGRLRLPLELFGAFYDWAEGERTDGEGLEAFAAAGVLSGGQPHPAVEPVVAAMADPVCVLSVRGAAADGSGVHGACWLGAEPAALLLDAPDDSAELTGVAPVAVPAAVARVVGLAPRPVSDAAAVPVPTAEVEALFQDGPPAAGYPALEAVGVSAADGARWWEVATRWPDAAGTPCTGRLRVLDSAAGLWAVTGGDAERSTWEPVSASAVWRLLLRCFPR
ncbi:ESX secretion-associated protein EspG [Streptomyces sp. NPDC053560]|uniref:ESX secretion-associated protein EspG n=1 Tax=Streptomyces sp. NPDC053560 TaxID=3365711 RepID=UPI0037CEB32D